MIVDYRVRLVFKANRGGTAELVFVLMQDEGVFVLIRLDFDTAKCIAYSISGCARKKPAEVE
jgi:hypothetical protein